LRAQKEGKRGGKKSSKGGGLAKSDLGCNEKESQAREERLGRRPRSAWRGGPETGRVELRGDSRSNSMKKKGPKGKSRRGGVSSRPKGGGSPKQKV